jgi:hypothetical protein
MVIMSLIFQIPRHFLYTLYLLVFEIIAKLHMLYVSFDLHILKRKKDLMQYTKNVISTVTFPLHFY